MSRALAPLAGAAVALVLLAQRRRARAQLVRRYYAAWADGDAAALRRLLGDDYCGHVHTVAGTEERDADGLADVLERHGEAFEWTEFDVRDLVRADGRVAARVAMRACHRETGEEGEMEGLAIFRVRRRRIVEEWSSWDYLGLAEQVGLATVS
jgi:ketosteroid isomerase-like protein